MQPNITLNNSQLNSLFPFHIQLSKSMEILSMGNSLQKLCAKFSTQKNFSELFYLQRPCLQKNSFKNYQSLIGQLIIVDIVNCTDNIVLRGQFEKIDNNLLFIGSPWFASTEQVRKFKLTLHDFALHDPMIDLLHVLKTQEITNNELKELLTTVNKQKQELKAAAEKFEDLALFTMQNPDPLFRIDVYGNIIAENAAAKQLTCFAYNNNEYTPKQFWKIAAKELSVNPSNCILEAFTNNKIFSFVCHYQPKLNYFNVYGRDITTQKISEQALKIKEEKYRNIIANISLGLLEMDNDENILYANQAFCNISKYSITELLNKKSTDLFGYDISTINILQDKSKLLNHNITDAYEMQVLDKKGEKRWWLISGAPNYNDKGEIIGSISIHLDITHQKKLQLELVDAKNNAEASMQAKNLFLANMSHEIRTPMNAIMGMSSQLAKTSLNYDQTFFLDSIKNAASNLLIILNDILDLSKIDAGKLSLENTGFELQACINRATEVMKHKAEEKGLTISNTVFDKKIAPILMGDPYRLNQILLNLISNSIKFTHKGFVDITCKLLLADKQNQKILIEVTDTGIGMDESFVKTIFQKFTQEDSSITRKYGGTGLGMSISKQLTQLMKGQIQVVSKKNVGTTVSVIIPFKKGLTMQLPKPDNITTNAEIISNKKILVVDDNAMNRMVAAAILKPYNANIIMAENGIEAIDKTKAEKPDIILMDVQMPIMDGLEATKVIRSLVTKKTPIIALTAFALKGDNKKCIEVGMNDYLSKPFEEVQLIGIITKWLSQQTKTSTKTTKQNIVQKNITTNQLFNTTKLSSLANGDKTFITEMLSVFKNQIIWANSNLNDAMYNNDIDKIKKTVHRIKPSLDNMCVYSLQSVIKDLEQNADLAANKNLLHTSVNTITSTFNSILQQL